MAYKTFGTLLLIRLLAVLVSFALTVYFFSLPNYHATTLLAALISVGLTYDIWRYITYTNRELARFLSAAKHQDLSQKFDFKSLGSGFDYLGDTFNEIFLDFKRLRSKHEEELKHIKALLEHVPFPLISIHENGKLTLWNHASRKQFGSVHLSDTSSLKQFGKEFHSELLAIQAGERKLVRFNADGVEQHLMIAATQIIVAGKKEQLISFQNIQSELETAQLQAWQDLVRVLTHEIMNSITPIASLAKTAHDLVEETRSKTTEDQTIADDLEDIGDAVQTVARRSEGLTEFVNSYRQLTRLPAPQKTTFALKELLSSVEILASQSWKLNGIHFKKEITPDTLELLADRKMIEQLLLNLLQNAEDAIKGKENGLISITARINQRNRIIIEVTDNGTGIDSETASKIFVPFYTTKRTGSGVGLALARQIMIAHRGAISHANAETGGSVFTLTF